jgi:hypothetical protein
VATTTLQGFERFAGSFRALTFLLWTQGCAEALYAFGVPRKPNSLSAAHQYSIAARKLPRPKRFLSLSLGGGQYLEPGQADTKST